MTEPTPATTTPAKAPAARKTPAKKAPAKKEYAPKVNDKGRLDHTDCGHDRTMAGRSKCRAVHKATTAQEAAKTSN